MAEFIFWDAWAFIALGDNNYRYHAQAQAVHAVLSQQDTIMITTEAMLSEVGDAFSKQNRRRLAQRQFAYAQSLVSEKSGQILHVDTDLWDRAWTLYHNRPDKDWGHTDCISFIVMQELGITKAFTRDQHFEQAGFIRLVKG